MLMTPSGTPARRESFRIATTVKIQSCKNYKKGLTSASARAENGVSGGGFITAVQPAASAAPNFRVIMAEGKFHGVRIELMRFLR